MPTARARRRRVIAAGMTLMVSFVTFGIVTVLYVTHVVHQSEQRLCGIIAVSLTPRPTPPTGLTTDQPSPEYREYIKRQSQITQQGIREMQKLSTDIGCKKVRNK